MMEILVIEGATQCELDNEDHILRADLMPLRPYHELLTEQQIN